MNGQFYPIPTCTEHAICTCEWGGCIYYVCLSSSWHYCETLWLAPLWPPAYTIIPAIASADLLKDNDLRFHWAGRLARLPLHVLFLASHIALGRHCSPELESLSVLQTRLRVPLIKWSQDIIQPLSVQAYECWWSRVGVFWIQCKFCLNIPGIITQCYIIYNTQFQWRPFIYHSGNSSVLLARYLLIDG